MRSEGARLIEAIQEAIEIGRRANTWVQIRHIKASGKANWGRMPQAVATIEAARASGIDVSADQYPYAASGTGLDAIIPTWAHAGGTDSLVARLQDPALRDSLRREIMGPEQRDELIGESSGGPTGVLLGGFRTDSLRRYVGILLLDVGRRHRVRDEAAVGECRHRRGRTRYSGHSRAFPRLWLIPACSLSLRAQSPDHHSARCDSEIHFVAGSA